MDLTPSLSSPDLFPRPSFKATLEPTPSISLEFFPTPASMARALTLLLPVVLSPLVMFTAMRALTASFL